MELETVRRFYPALTSFGLGSAVRPHLPAGSRIAPAPPEGLIGHALSFTRDPLRTLLAYQREVGDVVRLRLGVRTFHAIFHPEDARHVLVERARQYQKDTPGFAQIRLLLGNGLLTSQGDFWLRQRRIAQPAFHRERIAQFGALMVRATQDLVSEWRREEGRVIDVARGTMKLTLRIAGEALLGVDPSGDAQAIGDAITWLIGDTDARIASLWTLPIDVPTPRNRRFRRHQNVLDEVVRQAIEKRRADPAQQGDLLAMLISARDPETGAGMSDLQLRDEVMTMFLAGHETTANALAWTLAMLSRHPDVRRKLETELALVLGGRAATIEDVPRLRYTRMVIDETLRLYPPVWLTGRSAEEDDVIGGCFVPRGSIVFVSPFALHRRPELWENPEGFDPERFAPERAQSFPRHAYMPFGAGPRMCIGNVFAQVELVLALATIGQSLRLDLAPNFVLEAEPLITLRPKHGVLARVRAR